MTTKQITPKEASAILEKERQHRVTACNDDIKTALTRHNCIIETFQVYVNGQVIQAGWRLVAQ